MGHGASSNAVVTEEMRHDARRTAGRSAGEEQRELVDVLDHHVGPLRRERPAHRAAAQQREAVPARRRACTSMPSIVAAAARPASPSRPAGPGARAPPAAEDLEQVDLGAARMGILRSCQLTSRMFTERPSARATPSSTPLMNAGARAPPNQCASRTASSIDDLGRHVAAPQLVDRRAAGCCARRRRSGSSRQFSAARRGLRVERLDAATHAVAPAPRRRSSTRGLGPGEPREPGRDVVHRRLAAAAPRRRAAGARGPGSWSQAGASTRPKLREHVCRVERRLGRLVSLVARAPARPRRRLLQRVHGEHAEADRDARAAARPRRARARPRRPRNRSAASRRGSRRPAPRGGVAPARRRGRGRGTGSSNAPGTQTTSTSSRRDPGLAAAARARLRAGFAVISSL